jgi:hypothetical protein
MLKALRDGRCDSAGPGLRDNGQTQERGSGKRSFHGNRELSERGARRSGGAGQQRGHLAAEPLSQPVAVLNATPRFHTHRGGP